ncbi:MAG: hypothetical protein J6S72_03655, partial [Lachnospiraceae bacterium]|nr:hypothetical protein [Lachnospiraceae bacterium]
QETCPAADLEDRESRLPEGENFDRYENDLQKIFDEAQMSFSASSEITALFGFELFVCAICSKSGGCFTCALVN